MVVVLFGVAETPSCAAQSLLGRPVCLARDFVPTTMQYVRVARL